MLLALALTGALTTPAAAVADDEPPPADEDTGRYVVVMEDEPLVTEFGVDGVDSAPAQARAEELTESHERAASQAGVSDAAVGSDYTAALNGFAAELTPTQVDRIKTADGVLMVLEDFLRQPQTDSSIEFLGLTDGGGAHRSGVKGEGVIVGIIDSGIWPENPSFADDGSYPDPGVKLDETDFPACDFGNTAHNPDDAPFTCNNKLIGARQVLDTYRGFIGAAEDEFDSARDDNGHGSHTASTAAGNARVKTEIFGRKTGTITGVAPRAHIIAYKALGNLGGFTSDLAAAIDQAVFDGVDVINYSIGGGAGGVGADEIAFLFAAGAGVHVATSAGNSGPNAATLGDPGTKPWLTTVAASTQERFREAELEVAGREYDGASITPGIGERPVVDAEFAGGDLCMPGTLDEAQVAGKIVLCRRGAIGRAAKSLAVFQANGVGMILYNNDDRDNLFTDSHWVPSIHINNSDGLKAKQAIARRPGATAEIERWENEDAKGAPSITYFSSRGPNPVASDIIKPDITAPGHQILAAYSPFPDPESTVPGQDFASISGTSMSSPHVAGIMALMDEVHPDWSAAAVKSALMTTSHQKVRDDDRRSKADPFDTGSGHVDPGKVRKKGSGFNPGLVYEAGFNDYLGFLCDAFPEVFANPAATCAALADAGVPTKAVNLNYPSIGVAELAGSQTITRTVTSVDTGKKARKYEVKVDAPKGYKVKVTPKNIRVEPGETATYQVTITNKNAPIGEWRHGSLTWKGGGYEVRSPISVKGASLAAPAEITGTGVDGSASIDVQFGYTGPYTAAPHGLEPAAVISDTVLQDPDQSFDPSDVDSGGANLHQVTTSGAAALLIKMPPDAVNDPAIDIDIYVNGPNGEQIATSTAGGTDEEISLFLPDDGTYDIFVHGWQTAGPSADYDLYTWVISATPGGGNLVIDRAPASATSGVADTVDVSWTGAEGWNIGAVSHSDAAGLLGLTLVNVDNRP